MLIFYWTLVSTFFLGILTRLSYDKRFRMLGIFWVILIAAILSLVSGLRNGIGDTVYYMHSYKLIVENPSGFAGDKDFAFGLFCLILTNFSSDPQILIFVTAIITNTLNVIVFSKYRSYLELQIFMYITAGYYFVTMNGIRQCLVASVLFLCTKFIINGDFKKYFIIVVIMSTFHGSALIMIPVYFIVRQKAWSKKMIQFMIIAVIGVLMYNIISPIIFKLLQTTQYAGYSEYTEGGSSFLRTIINAIPVILAYLKRDSLKENWNESDVFVNIAIINLIFVTFGMFNWIFNRFTLYFQLYNYILVPFIIYKCFKGKERRLICFIFIICYFLLFFFENVIFRNMTYRSKYTLNQFFY